jgi:DNA-binding LytR/AlgR family response regulator
MLKGLVLEDSFRDYQQLETALDGKDFELHRCQNKEDLEVFIATRQKANVAIFDIQLGKSYDGIDMAELLLKHSKMPLVFMTNAYDNEAFARRAVSLGIPSYCFLSKETYTKNPKVFFQTLLETIDNFDYKTLEESLTKVIQQTARKIGIFDDNQYLFFDKEEIIYLEGKGDCALLRLTQNRSYILGRSIGHFTKQLENSFPTLLKLGASYLINTENIATLVGNMLSFKEADIKPILLSDSGVTALKRHILLLKTR